MGLALSTEILAQTTVLGADLTAVGGPLGAMILTIGVAGSILAFLRSKAPK